MANYTVSKIGARRTKPRFFDNLTEALEDAEIKSRKTKPSIAYLKAIKRITPDQLIIWSMQAL